MKQEAEIPSIQVLTRRDAADIAALEALYFTLPWSQEQYYRLLPCDTESVTSADKPALRMLVRNSSLFAFGIRANEQLIAYLCIAVHYSIHEMEIYTIVVHESARRQGRGKQLLAFCLPLLADCGILQAFLDVRASNVPALGLYEAMGFTRCGIRKKYYADTGEDAVLMQCDVTQFAGMPY